MSVLYSGIPYKWNMEFGYDTLCDFASLEARGSYTS